MKNDKTTPQESAKTPVSNTTSRRDFMSKLIKGDSENSPQISDAPETAPRASAVKMTRRHVAFLLAGAMGASMVPSGISHAQRNDRLTVPEDYKGTSSRDMAVATLMESGKAERYMRPHEVLKMQSSQDAIYRNYINPAFIRLLELTGIKNTVDDAIQLAMLYPYFFEYQDKGNNVIEIRKRKVVPNSNEENVKSAISMIPDDFYIKIEKEKGYITQVGKIVLVNTLEDSIPWAEGEYEKIFKNLQWPRFINSVTRAVAEQNKLKKLIEKILQSKGRRMSPELAQKLFELRVKKIWGSASKDVRNYLRINWIEMPKRIKEMIDIRNSGNKKVDFLANKDNAKRYEALRNFVEKMPSTYEGIGEKFINERELAGLLTMYPDEYPGMYFMQFGYKGAPKEWLITTPEGYFVDTEEDGKDYKPATEPSAINRDYYKNNLIKEYYKLNPEAKILADLEE